MAMEEVPSTEDELLMRYYDGELSPAEAADVHARLERDPAARAAVQAMAGLSELLREAMAAEPEGAERAAADDALRGLYARVQMGVRSATVEASTGSAGTSEPAAEDTSEVPRASAPRLRALPGGTAPADARGERRRRAAMFMVAGGFVAAAAAVALGVVVATGSGDRAGGDEGVARRVSGDLTRGLEPEATALVPGGSEVLEVQYGDGTAATQFTVETGDTPVAVIWINDEAPPGNP
jgi:anti-sigma factor RsiW